LNPKRRKLRDLRLKALPPKQKESCDRSQNPPVQSLNDGERPFSRNWREMMHKLRQD
jgi:hypothetical protein